MNVMTGHNSLAASADIEVVEQFAAVVDERVAKGIDDEASASKVRDLLAELTKRRNALDEQRKAEKEPHLQAGKAVDARYKRPLEIYDACKKRVGELLSGWLRKEQARIDAERAAANAEAARLAEEARRAAAESEASTIAAIDAERAFRTAEEAAKAAQRLAAARPQVESGHGNARRATLRVTRYARVSDFARAVKAYWGHQDVIAVLERLASADVRAGKNDVPGFEILERTNVA